MTCKKKKIGGDGGRHFAIKLSRSWLKWENESATREIQATSSNASSTLKKNLHIFGTLFPSTVVVTSNRSAVSCQVLQLLGDIHGVSTAHWGEQQNKAHLLGAVVLHKSLLAGTGGTSTGPQLSRLRISLCRWQRKSTYEGPESPCRSSTRNCRNTSSILSPWRTSVSCAYTDAIPS